MEMTVEREKMKALAVETLKKLDVYALQRARLHCGCPLLRRLGMRYLTR